MRLSAAPRRWRFFKRTGLLRRAFLFRGCLSCPDLPYGHTPADARQEGSVRARATALGRRDLVGYRAAPHKEGRTKMRCLECGSQAVTERPERTAFQAQASGVRLTLGTHPGTRQPRPAAQAVSERVA